MNLIGKWKVKEVLRFTVENGMEWKTVEELAAAGAEEQELAPYRDSITIFTEDGLVETLMSFPAEYTQEQIDGAVAEGMKIRDGMAVIGTTEWKREDGKNLYNTGHEGEIFGEGVSPWIEIKEIGDMIELEALRYVRAE